MSTPADPPEQTPQFPPGLNQPPVICDGVLVSLVNLQPLVEYIGQSGLRCGVPLPIDLSEEAGPNLWDLALVGRGLREVRVLPRDGVDAGIHEYRV
jgi:hypothetical protein